MSMRMKLFAGLALAAGIALVAPGTAQARIFGWGPYLYYGWPNPGFSFDIPRTYYYEPGPFYYAPPPPRCGWVSVRGWRNGHRVWRRVWRCW